MNDPIIVGAVITLMGVMGTTVIKVIWSWNGRKKNNPNGFERYVRDCLVKMEASLDAIKETLKRIEGKLP